MKFLVIFVADMTFESADTCMKILDLLVGKLEDASPIVKYKALNVIKNVLQKGSPAFFREIARKQSSLRECLNFRGPPDPLTGDTPYSQVRDMAQQVINLMYDAPPAHSDPNALGNPYAGGSLANASRGSFEPATQVPPAYGTGGMTSVSSTNIGAPTSNYRVSTTYAGTTADGGRRVYVNSAKAIGSYIEYQPSRLDTVMDAVNESIDSFKTNILGNPSEASAARSYGYTSSPVGIPPTVNSSARYTTGDVSTLDHAGPGDLSSYAPSSSAVKASHAQLEGFSRPTTVITDGWEYKLIAQLTPPNGRPAPARNEVADFVQKATQMASNGSGLSTMIEALLARIIVSEQWQCKLKAGYLLEALLKGVAIARDLVRPFLGLLREQSLIAVQASLSDKLNAVISTYPLSERPFDAPPAPESRTVDSPHSAAVINLLDDTAVPPHSDIGLGGGLFEGLQDHTAEKPSATASSTTLDDLLSRPAAKPHEPLVPAMNGSPMNGTSAPLYYSPPIVVPSRVDPISSPAQRTSLFDDLSLAPKDLPAPTAHQSSPSTSSLLLDFTAPINSTPPATTATQPAITDLEKDFFSKPATTPQVDPTATLRQLQPNTTYVATNQARENKTAQLAVLRGRLDAVNKQIELLFASGVAESQLALIAQLAVQKQELTVEIQQIERLTPAQTTTTTMSLEALYRQQPSPTGATSIDYNALQTSHPADPFDAIRHEIRQ